MDYNARFYSPSLGRFIQPDTLIPDVANPQAYNRYSYVLNNPLRYTDPTGHYCVGDDEDCADEAGDGPAPIIASGNNNNDNKPNPNNNPNDPTDDADDPNPITCIFDSSSTSGFGVFCNNISAPSAEFIWEQRAEDYQEWLAAKALHNWSLNTDQTIEPIDRLRTECLRDFDCASSPIEILWDDIVKISVEIIDTIFGPASPRRTPIPRVSISDEGGPGYDWFPENQILPRLCGNGKGCR